jgi:hypothetical protein
LIEYIQGSFEERRAGALENKRSFLGKSGGDLPLVRPAGQRQYDHAIGKRPQRRERQGRRAGRAEKVATGCEISMLYGQRFFHGRSSDSLALHSTLRHSRGRGS